MRIDQKIDIRGEVGRIVVAPAAEPSYDLDALLDAMTPETFPDEANFGVPVGKETW